jgi:hypothetical protein
MSVVYLVPTQYDGTAFYTQRTTFDGVDYQLDFAWSTREERWYLSILDTSGNLILGPVKILTNWPMLQYYHDRAGCPPGELIATSVNPDDSPPGFEELGIGRRVTLTYIGVL